MAATLHVDDAFPVNRPRSPSGDDTSLSVIGLGPFGERVAQHLLGTRPDAKRVAAADLGNAFTATGEAVVLALWRPEPELCEQADELSWRRGVPWLPVVMDHRAVSVGPLVSQPGPCFRCYRRRREQHDVQPAATAALLAAYARDAGAGPAGYLPHHARMAAGLATQMLRGDLVPAAAGRPAGPASGLVATVRLLQERITVSPVVACHDCARCGGPPGPAGDLARVLARFRQDHPARPAGRHPVAGEVR